MSYYAAGLLVLGLAVSASALYTVGPASDGEEEGGLVKVVMNGFEHTLDGFSDFLTKGFAKGINVWPMSEDGYVHIDYRITQANVSVSNTEKAMRAWEEGTCVRFHELGASADPKKNFLNIYSGSWCYSYMGPMNHKGTGVSMYPACGYAGYVHELGHALGLHHDMQRRDRDTIMTVLFENSKEGVNTYPFKDTIDYGSEPDFTSVMMYPPFAKSKNKKPVMLPKDPRWFNAWGWATTTSFMNRLVINRALGCDKTFLAGCHMTADPCMNGGYMGPECECICKPGTDGDHCKDPGISYNEALLKKKSPYSAMYTKPGIISSPDYPNTPRKKIRSTQVLKAPKCNRVVLTFLEDIHMLYRSNNKCPFDWLTMRDGNKDFEGKTFCATEIKKGQVFKSTGNEFIVNFGFYGWKYKGYKASWKWEPIPGCS